MLWFACPGFFVDPLGLKYPKLWNPVLDYSACRVWFAVELSLSFIYGSIHKWCHASRGDGVCDFVTVIMKMQVKTQFWVSEGVSGFNFGTKMHDVIFECSLTFYWVSTLACNFWKGIIFLPINLIVHPWFLKMFSYIIWTIFEINDCLEKNVCVNYFFDNFWDYKEPVLRFPIYIGRVRFPLTGNISLDG